MTYTTITSELMETLFQDSDEFLKSDRIPPEDKPYPSERLCGYIRVASLMKKPERFSPDGNNDMVYLCGIDNLRGISDEDVLYLTRCGITYDPDTECLIHY